jgi:SAM-dependent methyltransferase
LSLPQDISIIKCKRCGLRWIYPIKSAEEYQNIYKTSYFEEIPEDYKKVISERNPHFLNRIKEIKKYMKRDEIRLLDVGAATGEFITEARKSGIESVGIEPSKSACQRAKNKYGIDMIQGNFLDVDFGSKTFDVVHMNHVFEHFSEPERCLEKVRRVLKDDGLLVMEVPNQFNNILYLIMHYIKRLRPEPFSIYSIHHPFFYTPKSFGLLLKKFNFEIIELTSWKSYIKTKSRSFYHGATFIEHFVLFLGDLFLKGGLFIEIYSRKRKKRLM